MPRRSSVFDLPVPTITELNGRIAASGYGDYAGHAAWLAEQGRTVSVSALQRYGVDLRHRAEKHSMEASGEAAAVIARMRHTAEIARAVDVATDGDSLDNAERTAALCMTRLYEIATREDIDAKSLQALAQSLNASLRTVTASRTRRDTERQKALEEARERAVKEMRRQGLSPTAEAAIRAAVEGTPNGQREA